MSAAHGKVDFEQRLWRLTSELAGLLRESLDEGTIAFEGLGEWRSRWNVETPAEQAEELDLTGEQTGSDMSPHEPANGSASHIQEEDEMPEPRRTDPKELLQKAQEALQSGDGAGAKEFALKAAEIISKLEAEEARKKEKSLRSDLEKAMRDAADAEETFRHLKEEITERDRELAIHATRLAEAQSSFDDRQRSSQEIKEQIDKTEAEIAVLKEKHKELLASYQDTLPARDAVQREVTRARTGVDKLQSEIATMRETVNDGESHAQQAHQRKQAIETELQKLLQKASG
jgi:chromosome segregation ATPase